MFHQQSQVDYQHFIPLTDGSFDVSNCYQYPPPLIPIGAGQAGHAMDTTFPPQTMINKPFMKNRPNGLIYRNISPSNNTFGVQESRGGENQAKPSKKQGIQQSFSPSEQSQHKERSLELDQSDRQGYELSPSPFEQLEEPSLRQNQSEPQGYKQSSSPTQQLTEAYLEDKPNQSDQSASPTEQLMQAESEEQLWVKLSQDQEAELSKASYEGKIS